MSAPQRRNFIVEFAALVLGGVATLFALATGLVVFFDPLRQRNRKPTAYRTKGAAGEGFVRIASLDSLPEDGTPRFFPVVADRVDAWNYYPSEPVGSVFLRRIDSPPGVQALHSTCPHLGCTLGYAASEHQFRCPCHESAFNLQGERLNQPGKINPAPRSMDPLQVDARRLADSGEIWIRFVNFYTGKEEPIPKV